MGKQRGVVLILAMLIVALVTTIVVSLSWRYNLSLTRSENRWHGLQSQSYLQGAEALAQVVLAEDAREDQDQGRPVDTLGEFWAQPADAFPTDEGWVEGTIEDAQGRFNLNLLQTPSAAQQGTTPPQSIAPTEFYTANQKRFIRLLQTFELEDGPIDQAEAIAITDAVIDWVDPDQAITGFGGAEVDFYQQLEPPITPPDLHMISVSELSQIKGVTPELYRALLPLVVALPVDAALNVNTMPVPLLRTLAGKNELGPLTEEDAQLLAEERLAMESGTGTGANTGADAENGAEEGGFDDINALTASPVLDTLVSAGGGLDGDGLVFKSDYFLLFTQAQVGEQLRSGASLLHRQNDQVTVIRRTDANF